MFHFWMLLFILCKTMHCLPKTFLFIVLSICFFTFYTLAFWLGNSHWFTKKSCLWTWSGFAVKGVFTNGIGISLSFLFDIIQWWWYLNTILLYFISCRRCPGIIWSIFMLHLPWLISLRKHFLGDSQAFPCACRWRF